MNNEESYKKNIETYSKKNTEGYDLKYPEGHVIRFNVKVLRSQFNLTGGNLLDFGCNTGIHTKYFTDNGFVPYGTDVVESVVEACKKLLPDYKDNFHYTEAVPDLKKYFGDTKFDLIFANQVMYYLNDKDMKNVIQQMYNMAKPGAVFYASMISKDNYSYNCVTEKNGDMSKVVYTGRLTDVTHVNFKDKEELPVLFEPFKMFYIGEYDTNSRADEGSTKHYMFVGVKE